MSNKRHKKSHLPEETKDVACDAFMLLPLDLICSIMSMSNFFNMFKLWPLVCKTTKMLVPSCRVYQNEISFDLRPEIPAAAFTAMQPLASLVQAVAILPRCDTSAVLDGIRSWTNVKRLSLCGCVMDRTTRVALYTSATRLVALDLSDSSRVTDELLSELVPRMPSLEQLVLRSCVYITDEALEHISKLKELHHLDISMCNQITDRGLSHVANLPLTTLGLNFCKQITRAGFVHLSRMPLIELHLVACLPRQLLLLPGAPHGFSYLSDLKLQILDLSFMNHDSFKDALVYLQAMPLEHLKLDSVTCLSDAGLAHLAKLPLKSLSMFGCKNITTLAPLAAMQLLVDLNLTNCPGLRDEELKHLSPLNQLTSLYLDENNWLSHAGLTYLTALVPHLRQLSLWNCEGMAEAKLYNEEEQRRCVAPLKALAAGNCRVDGFLGLHC